MSSTKFTKGPWSLHCYAPSGGLTIFCDENADRGAFVAHKVAFGAGEILLGEVSAQKELNDKKTGYPRVSDFAENVANAHLIAAAPELYAALLQAQEYLHDVAPAMEYDANEALLKKARGEA